jgi:hypothetical protein
VITKQFNNKDSQGYRKGKRNLFDILKRILEKLENKNSFKKKRDVLKTTQKHLRIKREYSRFL